jgi:putative spermidine/putrescine transport system substrate-binding protein
VACNPQNKPLLRLNVLQNSIPLQLIKEFRRQPEQQATVEVSLIPQLAELFTSLRNWKSQPEPTPTPPGNWNLPWSQPQSPPIPDLITLGDYWLTAAIQQGLIQPLTGLPPLKGWQSLTQQLVPDWRSLVQRNSQGQPDLESGALWGVPYRFGSLVMAYRRDAFQTLGWTLTNWSDLWRPELRGKISLPDSARLCIGIALKKLRQPLNTLDLAKLPQLKAELQTLHQQVKFYSSTAYLQPLLLEDTWVAVGWSNEVLSTAERNRHTIAAVVPQSGTALTADLWVRPASSPALAQLPQPQLATLKQWIEFYWDPQIATQLSLLSRVASPILTVGDRAKLPPAVQQNPVLLPSLPTLQQSEFLLSLPPDATEQYRRLWVEVRQTG